MALPVLESPTYTLNLPSTDQSVKFRPFLVKEHKVLMTLSNSDSNEVSRVIRDLVDTCTFGSLDVRKLPSFDLEYIFVNLRAKSIGEIIPITLTCTNCKTQIKSQIDLNKVQVEKGKQINPKIYLRDKIGITLNYPKFDHIVTLADDKDKTKIFEMIAGCIENIFTEDEMYENFTVKEAEDFLLQFTKDEFQKIEDFFVNIPKVVQNVEEKCPNCGEVNKTKIQGLQNFFV